MSRVNWTNEKLFFRLLKNKTKKTYWSNIHELRKRPCQEVFVMASSLCNSNLDKQIIVGIDVLAQLGVNKRYNQKLTIDICFSSLKKTQTPKVLYTILSAIGHNNNSLKKKQIQTISEFKNHKYSDVRFGVVSALMGIESELGIETLIKLSNDKHNEVRDWATFSIGSQIEMDSEIIRQALKERLNDKDHNTRSEAISGLAQRQDNSVKEILIDELEKIDNHGSLILESIEVFGDLSFIPLIEAQIEKNKNTKMINEKWLVDCLENLKKHA